MAILLSFLRGKEMKKAIIVLLAAVMLTACTGYNNSTSVTENGIYYHLSSNGKEAMAGSYLWDGKENTAVITIPDKLSDGAVVNKMGGFIGIGVPVAFKIDYDNKWPELPKSSKSMSEEEVDAFYKDYADTHPDELFGHLVKVNKPEDGQENTEPQEIVYKDITFTVNIGKNVSSIHETISEANILYVINSYGIEQADGSILVYRPSLFFNVDPENKTYYSEDGVLYNTADGKPVLKEVNE